MKASYNFTRDYCGHQVIKVELMKIRDNSIESAQNVSQDQLTQFAPPAIGAGNIEGKLYRNHYVYYCLNCILPTRRTTWEVEGYHTKLSETEQLIKCCQCCPDYEIRDRDSRILGTFVTHCRMWPCRKPLDIHTGRDYTADTDCCNCCSTKWLIKDAVGNTVSDVQYTTCLGFKPNYQINFYGNLSLQDRIVFMSSLPFLY